MSGRAGLAVVAIAALLLGCQGSVGPGGEPPDGGAQDGASKQLDKGQPKRDSKLDKGTPKPKLDKGKPPPDKSKPPPDPCKPLPKGCLCAQACVKGACDNTRCPCKPIPGASYGATLSPSNPSKVDPKKHVDVNLLMRKRKAVSFKKGIIKINGPTDPTGTPPQLYSLFVDNRVPAFPHVYQVQNWDWGCNCFKGYIGSPEVTLAGMATKLDEVIRTPKSSYHVGGGNTAMVLLATKNTITLKYTTEDDVVKGYTVHISGICVEPALQKLYDQCHNSGRKKLPALKNTQPLGRAIFGEIQVAIRDTGAWMDPRSRKDWWQGK